MSKRRAGQLAALGGAALLAMKMAKGDRKDAAPIEDKGVGKKGRDSSDMRKRAEEDTEESGIGRYARETGIGTMRQPARDSGRTSARTPAARTPAAAPVVPRSPIVGRTPAADARDIPSMMSGIGTRPSFGITPGREVDPNVLRAMQRAGGMKKGGTVKKKSGGMISKASKRADGCAIKGKTKGRFV